MIRLPRWMHRLYASWRGYFWLPCPLCGEPFGGHEWRHVSGKSSSIRTFDLAPQYGIGICPDCTLAGLGGRTYRREDLHPASPERWGS